MLECPHCGEKLPLPTNAVEKTTSCPTCHRSIPLPTPVAASFSSISFKARVRDPRDRFHGTVQACLTPAGLELGQDGNKVALSIGTEATYRGTNRLTAALEGEQLEISVFKPFHYQNRLARDAADFLKGTRSSMSPGDYVVPWYLFLPALLPLGIPILTLGGAIPGAVGFGLAGAAIAVVLHENWHVGVRIAVCLLLGLAGYAGLFAVAIMTGIVSLPSFGGIADSQWQKFTPPDKRFHISLPGTPENQFRLVPTPVGEVGLQLYSVKVGGNEYGVAYSDLPVELSQNVPLEIYLNGVRDGIMQPYQGNLKSEKQVSLGKFSGKEFTFEMNKPKGKGAARIFRLQNRLYQLIVIGRWLNPESKDVHKFFDSFSLPSGPPEIATKLRDRYFAMQIQACMTLAISTPQPRLDAAPTLGLLLALKTSENTVKSQAVQCLIRDDPRNREPMLALLRHFLRGEPEARMFGILALADLGPNAHSAVSDLEYLTQPNWPPETQQAARDALRRIQAP